MAICFSLSLSRLGGSKDVEYRLAQSGDATCSGLDNSDYGSRIMTLKKSGTAERCDFPKWFKEPKHWHSLNGELSYNVHQKYVFACHQWCSTLSFFGRIWCCYFIHSSCSLALSRQSRDVKIWQVQGTVLNLIEWNSAFSYFHCGMLREFYYVSPLCCWGGISLTNSDICRATNSVWWMTREWAYHDEMV